MPRILLSKAQPGQVLTRPVTTSAGVVMVQAGSPLTPALIERLTNFGVDTVVVGDDARNEWSVLHLPLSDSRLSVKVARSADSRLR